MEFIKAANAATSFKVAVVEGSRSRVEPFSTMAVTASNKRRTAGTFCLSFGLRVLFGRWITTVLAKSLQSRLGNHGVTHTHARLAGQDVPRDGTGVGVRPRDGTGVGVRPSDGAGPGVRPSDGARVGLIP